MDVNQALQNQHGSAFLNQKLDMAFVYFFMQFRKSYIGETNGKSVKKKIHCYTICTYYIIHIVFSSNKIIH